MRRFILFFIILALLPHICLGETGAERLSTLDIISQREERFTDERFYYQDMYFRIAGCKPASLTNALVALLGNAGTNTPELLLEVRDGLNPAPWNEKSGIAMYLLHPYLCNPADSAVELRKLLRPVTNIIYLDSRSGSVTPIHILSQALSDPGVHPLFIREMAVQSNWHWLIDIAAKLCELDHPDARFVLCAASVGTDTTDGPLRSGAGGHYVTIYFRADEFYQEGTMYLLDSLPRALPGDVYGTFEHYPSRYPFTTKWRKDAFDATYDATRIIDPVLQFTLKPAELTQLNSLALDSPARAAQLAKKAETLILYDKAWFMLYIP